MRDSLNIKTMEDEKLMSKMVEACSTRSDVLKGLGAFHIKNICSIYNVSQNQNIEKMISAIVKALADSDGLEIKYYLYSHDMY